MRAGEIGAASHLRDVRESTTDAPCSGPENHLKKVPVLEAGHIVVSSTAATSPVLHGPPYLADHPSAPSTAVRPGQHVSAWKRPASVKFGSPGERGHGALAFGKPRGQLPWVKKTPGCLGGAVRRRSGI